MSTRSADATIKGYYYQFDTSILKLLELKNDSESIVVEGIEDIDIHTSTETTAIQCKYLSEPTFINSKVRKPIILMLDNFVNPNTSNDLKYVLYAHFENEEVGKEPAIDLKRLKEILSYTEDQTQKRHYEEKGISDAQLNSFLGQFDFKFGLEFNKQQSEVMGKIRKRFKCSEFMADFHYYNNALRVIMDLAIKKVETERRILKSEFFSKIDCGKTLFNEWYCLLRSKEKYLKEISDNLTKAKILLPSKTKFVIIGKEILNADNSQLPFYSFVENLIEKFYKIGVSFKDAKPITIIVDCSSEQLREFKKSLIEGEILFNDGYESIHFSPKLFNQEPVKIRTLAQNKIEESSYSIRLISSETLISNIDNITKPKVILHFAKDNCPYDHSANYSLFQIKYHCETLYDISLILTK